MSQLVTASVHGQALSSKQDDFTSEPGGLYLLPLLTPSTTCTSNAKSGQWIKNTVPLCPGGLLYKDFLPTLDADRSTCCSKEYATFSETVQKANEWLGRHEGCEVVACESLPFSSSGHASPLPDTWPTTTHLRGLRVWLRGSVNPENGGSSSLIPRPRSQSRVLLSYRDFSPYFDGKSMFATDYEDVNVLLDRVNVYLADRATAAKVLSLQTLDTPMDGLLDVEVDTERSQLTFSQHGFTRYCRSLRVFSVTKYKRVPALKPLSQPTIAIKDFAPNGLSSNQERISDVIKRAMKWCAMHEISFLNMQVLSQRAGESDTSVSTWLLESPGHIPNKFYSFVRVVYVGTIELPEDKDSVEDFSRDGRETPDEDGGNFDGTSRKYVTSGNASLFSDTDTDSENVTNKMNKKNTTNASGVFLEDVGNMPGVISSAEKNFITGDLENIHCKIFVPRLMSAGGLCSHAEWESLEQTIVRLNSWASASQGTVLTIHTQYLYSSGSEEDAEETQWARYMSRGQQIGALHAVVVGGRPPTALPTHPVIHKSKCSVM